jgi:hypothetical protein
VGFAVDSTNAGISGATVNLMSSRTVVASTVTDSTGFYYFTDVSGLTPGANYVILPKGYKSSTPASQSFTWQASMVALANFVLN